MKYDFNSASERRGTGSYKWDSAADPEVLPLWVADMDLRTAPAIIEALRRRVDHGIFGYTLVGKDYYDAVTGWFNRRHGWNIDSEWIIYTSGVVPAISAIIKALTKPGDKVLVQTPVYNCFFSSIRNNDCEREESPLVYSNNTYTINFADLEQKASDPGVKVMLLCNPHNPAGRVWNREEIEKIGEICIRHNVTVISDEIHCELVMPGYTYTPFGSISEEFRQHSISCVSPSKAFNIAGLQIANIVCADKAKRAKIDRAINDNEVCDVNPFGVIATRAAYNDSEEWLGQLIEYLYGNYKFMEKYCAEHLPEFPLTKLEGTYLVWMNTTFLGIGSEELEDKLLKEEKLWLNAGTMYGSAGEGFMRWNIACPRGRLEKALDRFDRFVHNRK